MANSRITTNGAAITGIVRTAVVAAANVATGGATGAAVTAAAADVGKLAFGALDWTKVKNDTEEANQLRNGRMVSTATQQPPAQPQQNQMMGLLAGLGPMLGSALSNIGSLFKSGGSGNGAPQISPNPQNIAQNTPDKDKDKEVTDPKNKENQTAPNPKGPIKPQNPSTVQPNGEQLYGQATMFNPDSIS
jgi:DNA replication initiation complex subunit (GINS family)